MPLEESPDAMPEWEMLTRVHLRFALYIQLIIAAGCTIVFEQGFRTGWVESALRNAYAFNLLPFFWVLIAAAIAHCSLWRRLVSVMASCVLTLMIFQACAMVLIRE